MKNPKREKLRATMSKESTMVMGEYIIDIRAMCPKKRLMNDYKITQTLSYKTRIVELIVDQKEEQLSKSSMAFVFLICLMSF